MTTLIDDRLLRLGAVTWDLFLSIFGCFVFTPCLQLIAASNGVPETAKSIYDTDLRCRHNEEYTYRSSHSIFSFRLHRK